MSLDVLCTGRLVKPAETRQAKSGSTYAVAQLSVAIEGDEAGVLCSLIAFRDTAVEALLVLGPGDAVSVAGRARVTTWTGRDGEAKAGLSIVVEQVMSVYAVRRKREAVQARDDADDATPTAAPDRRPQGRDSSRSGQSAREARPAQGTLAVCTDRVADLSDDIPWTDR